MITILHRTLALAALSALSLAAAPAFACSCVPQTVEQAKQDAVAIFEGRVTSIAPAPDSDPEMPQLLVTFEVARSWQGLTDQTSVTLRTAESSASCGYGFRQEASYLVYATGSAARLEGQLCSRTQPVSDASEDLAALGAGVAPGKREPARDGAPPTTKRAGCASTSSASASTSALPFFWFGTSGLALFASRGRRKR
ncbi:MAG TPA: hypothetical protein VMF89_03825 [Polyangiales bacterium]|nr:hypothetical protein [Polyangiales bacterium]